MFQDLSEAIIPFAEWEQLEPERKTSYLTSLASKYKEEDIVYTWKLNPGKWSHQLQQLGLSSFPSATEEYSHKENMMTYEEWSRLEGEDRREYLNSLLTNYSDEELSSMWGVEGILTTKAENKDQSIMLGISFEKWAKLSPKKKAQEINILRAQYKDKEIREAWGIDYQKWHYHLKRLGLIRIRSNQKSSEAIKIERTNGRVDNRNNQTNPQEEKDKERFGTESTTSGDGLFLNYDTVCSAEEAKERLLALANLLTFEKGTVHFNLQIAKK